MEQAPLSEPGQPLDTTLPALHLRMEEASSYEPITLDHPGDEIITGRIHMPLAHGRNHATPTVEAECLAWLCEHGLLTPGSTAVATVRAGRFHELAGHAYRHEDRDALQIAADFISALFFFDDLVDTDQSYVGRDSDLTRRLAGLLAAGLRSGEPPAPDAGSDWPLTPADRRKVLSIAAAFADIRRRLARRHPTTLEPFFQEVDVYFESMAHEAAHRVGRDYASLDDYASVRTSYSAVYVCIELGLVLRGVALSPATRRDAHLRLARQSANLSVAYINDLFSYKRELLLGESTNLVMLLERLHGLSLAEAFEEACRMANEQMRRFLSSRAAIEARDPGARAATELFESWVRGNYDWHVGHTQRYSRALSTHHAAPRY